VASKYKIVPTALGEPIDNELLCGETHLVAIGRARRVRGIGPNVIRCRCREPSQRAGERTRASAVARRAV